MSHVQCNFRFDNENFCINVQPQATSVRVIIPGTNGRQVELTNIKVSENRASADVVRHPLGDHNVIGTARRI